MKNFFLLGLFIQGIISFATAQVVPATNPNLAKDTTKKSISSVAIGTIGKDTVKIQYHSPAVRNRVIWGGLVRYGEVWVTGGHDATSLEINKPFKIGGVTIPAGKYAFFTIPGIEEWTVIINKNYQQHNVFDYSATEDVVRIKVKPKKIDHLERLQYFIADGKISVSWEKLRIDVPVKIIN